LTRLVIADTGPINYLVLIGRLDLLPVLFEKIVVPTPVLAELSASNAPSPVRGWIATLPAWVEVHKTPPNDEPDPAFKDIHAGEVAAIRLAMTLKADLLLMDDRKGVNLARNKGLRVTGTLGILELAAMNGLTDLPLAIERLRQTNFRCPNTVLDALLRRHSKGS
jgi:predicted nucleic acid-binding protein